MATALQNLIDAYIKRNANQEITGPVLNGVLTAISNALGTPFIGSDGYWYTYDAETGQFVKTDTPAQGETGPVGVTEAAATIDDQIGTPSVAVSLNGTRLDFAFRNLKGQKGDTGDAGITAAVVTVDAGIGTPSVDASITGTTLTLAFHNLKGETGAAAGFGTIEATVDDTTGTPAVVVTESGPDTAKNLSFAFSGLKGQKGDQGDTGVSADYPITIANNLTTDDPTAALAASQGVVLKGEIDQLGQEVDDELDGSAGRIVTNTNFNDTGKFLYGTGTLDSASYNITDYIDIEGCEEIIVTNVWEAPNGILSYVIYDSAKNILATNPTPESAGNRNYDITTIPSGAKYIRCTQNYQYSSSVEIHYPSSVGLKSRVSSLEAETESLDGRVTDLENGQLDLNIQDTITAKNQISDFTTYSDTHLNTTNGQTASSTSFICSDFVPILPETDYTCGKIDATFGGFKVWDMQEICYYDESKAFLSATTSKRTITSPSGAKFLRFSVLSTTYSESLGTASISELEIVQGTSPVSVFGRDVFGDILPLNGLKGKKWLVIGDSNTEHNFRANGKYDEFIASFTGVVPTNIGVSGAGFRVYENANLVYLNILNSFITNNPTYKPDFITIMGGTNDVNFDGANIGTYTDETTSTVFGYMYLLVQRIKEAFPNVPFAICTQFPQNYGDESKQTLLTSFVQGEMDFCKYRNIPCLDLFFCSGLRPEESGFNAHYYSCSASPNGDGIHLNYFGQKLISARIREFLLSYFGES